MDAARGQHLSHDFTDAVLIIGHENAWGTGCHPILLALQSFWVREGSSATAHPFMAAGRYY
jgi:hypothetical protein